LCVLDSLKKYIYLVEIDYQNYIYK
jgi:hypothetical protein